MVAALERSQGWNEGRDATQVQKVVLLRELEPVPIVWFRNAKRRTGAHETASSAVTEGATTSKALIALTDIRGFFRGPNFLFLRFSEKEPKS